MTYELIGQNKNISNYTRFNKCLLFVLFVVYPLIAMPVVIWGIFNKKKYCFTYLAAFMGLTAVLYPPYGDVYRYTLDFLLYKQLDFYTFIILSGLKFDFLLSYLAYGLGELDMNFDLYRFIYSFVGYQLLFNIFNSVVERNRYLQEKKVYRAFFILYFSLFVFTSFSFRFGFSTILYVYAVYKLIYIGSNKGWLYMLLAVINHFSFAVFFILLLGVKKNLFERSRKFLLFCIVISFCFDNGLILENVMKILPLQESLLNHMMEYVNGNADQNLYADRPLTAKIGSMIGIISLYPVMYYSYKFHQKNILFSVIIQMFVLLACTAPFLVVYQRYAQITIVLFVLYFSAQYTHTLSERKCLKVILTFCLFSFLFHLYTIRKVLYASEEYKLLYSSFPVMINYSYDEKWLYNNVSQEGDLLPAMF